MAVVKRGKVWQAQVRTGKDPRTGKWIRKSATADTKAEAERAERRLLAEAEADQRAFVQPSDITLEAFVNEWRVRKWPKLRVGTRGVYDSLLRSRIVPALGKEKIVELSPQKVQAWIDRQGPSVRTEEARLLLGTVCKDAVRLGLVTANVVLRTEPPHREKPKRESFSMDEARRIFAVADGTRIGPLVRFATYTGLRRGEICGLRWGDVFWDAPNVQVRRQVVVAQKVVQVQEAPKTRAGWRGVPLVAQAVDALKAQRAMIARERLASGRVPEDPEVVFPTRGGTLLDPNYVTRTFKRVVERAGVEVRPFHALRHTAASLLLAAGLTPEVCAKLMGHASIGMFYATYADLLTPAAQDAARQVERFLAAEEAAAAKAMSAIVSAKPATDPRKTYCSKTRTPSV